MRNNACHFSLVILFLLPIFSLAQTGQAPYLGGSGDGYHRSTDRFFINWDPAPRDTLSLFPSPALRGETVHIIVLDLHSKLEVILRDAKGQIAWRHTQWEAAEEAFMDIPTDRLAAGSYVVEVRRDGQSTTRKLIVQDE